MRSAAVNLRTTINLIQGSFIGSRGNDTLDGGNGDDTLEGGTNVRGEIFILQAAALAHAAPAPLTLPA